MAGPVLRIHLACKALFGIEPSQGARLVAGHRLGRTGSSRIEVETGFFLNVFYAHARVPRFQRKSFPTARRSLKNGQRRNECGHVAGRGDEIEFVYQCARLNARCATSRRASRSAS